MAGAIGAAAAKVLGGDAMTVRQKLLLSLDRTLVLFVGVAVGSVVGASLIGGAVPPEAQAGTAAPTPVAAAHPAPVREQAGARLLRSAANGGTVHVGVFGDSFGDGIWAGLYQQLPTREGIAVHKLSRQATGFTRYRTTDLLEDTRRRLALQPIDIAVLSFGANDTQGIYHEGRGAAFMSERWRRIVAERAGAVVALLREHGASVYWVGLPTMREPGFDAQIRQINAFHAELMRRLGVPFIDTANATADVGGRYAPYLTEPRTGRRFMARVNDGVHMTIPGYILVTRGLSDRIEQAIADARGRGGVPARTARP
jgi:hypothetical protein